MNGENEGDSIQAEKLELEVTHELMVDLQEFSQSHELAFEESIRMILGAGLGFLRAEQAIKGVAAGKYSAVEIEKLVTRLVETESRLAATRFRMQEIQSANDAWNLSTGAVNTEREALSKVVWRQKEDIARLSEEISRLEQENQSLRVQIEQAQANTENPGGNSRPKTSERSWRKWFGSDTPRK